MMNTLKQKRSTVRGAFTRSANNIDTLLASSELKADELEVALEQLSEKYKQLKKCDDQVFELLQKEVCSQETYDTEYASCEKFDDRFIGIKTKVKKVISRPVSKNYEGSSSNNVHSTESVPQLRLPEIQLTSFDGNPKNWLNFWSQYLKIHENNKIDPSDKFQYLIQSTVPGSKPREIVLSFPATADNYPKAVGYLKERFGNESVLIQVYIRELLHLVIKEKRDMDLPSLYDKLQTQLMALDSLGVTQEKYADIIFPLVESCLPSDTIRAWERSRFTSASEISGKNDLDSLIKFLKHEVESELRIKLARNAFSSEKLNKKNSKRLEIDTVIPTASELLSTSKTLNNKDHSRNFKKPENCVFCENRHFSESCKDISISKLSLADKKNIVKTKKACFVCLRLGHRAVFCKSNVRCSTCQRRHFPILCPELASKMSQNYQHTSNSKVEETVTSTLNNHVKLSDVYLQTLVVRLHNGTKDMLIRAIFDTGSMKSYISTDIAQSMNYKSISEVNLKQSLFGGIETVESVYSNYDIEVSDVDNTYKCKFEVLGQKRICSEIKQLPSGPWLNELKIHGIKITDLEKNTFKVDKEIKLLIGADVAGKLLTGKVIALKSNLTAVHTQLGWTVLGKFFSTESNVNTNHSLITSLLVNNQCISDLWKLDVLGITDPAHRKSKIELEEETNKYFNETICVNSESRYEVTLPWVVDSSSLPDNKKLAEKSLLSTKRKLVSMGKLEAYHDVFEDWLALGIIEKVPEGEPEQVHYLPHRPVVKENSTTRLRPVFNASSHSVGSPSLNNCLSTGPNLIEIIPTILNRFRKNYVAVVSDIEKAFLQISIREKDRDFLRFLWFRKDSSEQVEVYRHRRVVFGLTCSPYLLAATLQYHLSNVPENLSCTAETLKSAFYVDNCVTSLDSESEMRKFVLESQIIMTAGNFNLRGWQSNLRSVVPEDDSTTEETISVLGLEWHTDSDTLSCKIPPTVDTEKPITKRLVLAVAHQIFDPIGFTAPVMLIPKLILQETWELKLKWDEILPDNLIRKFKSWYQQLSTLSEIKLPRWLNISPTDISLSLHVFCDASQRAYAACVYLRAMRDNEITVSLVQARSRVAPLKPLTIPRLELLACLIGARLLATVVEDLQLYNVNIYCWTDSTTVLCWIRRDQNWGTFVQNRVREIRTLTSPNAWQHIPGALNIADVASRGCSVEQLLKQRWWEGPAWLRDTEENWPKSEDSPDEDLVNSEMRKTIVITLSKNCDNVNWYYKYFSSITKIIRMLAWIFRFYNKLRKTSIDCSKILSVTELEKAEVALMLLIQKESFLNVNDDKLKKFRPVVDCNGLIRATTNVAYRDDANDFKFPIILPSDHTVVKLLIIKTHNDLLHAGTSMLMSHLREKYWIINARKTIRNCIRKCVKCQRFNSKNCDANPGTLPNHRVRDAAIFEIVGVDLAGPLYLKDGKKAYIALYTCAVYRAIHLELITSLTTETFFQSLRRFIARRGRPFAIYSDNGTNFKGAERLLHELDWESLLVKVAEQKIQWKFNPPTAAWWGGWWERLVQMVKQILRKILGRAALDYEELLTVLCDCERIINARPLTYVSEDIRDISPLTPEMFLRELPKSGVPDIDIVDKEKLTKRAKYLQGIREQLRRRFRSEYLGQLRQQTIKNCQVKSLQAGEVVLLEDINKRRTFWNLARVEKLIPGRDGQVRLALVKTEHSEFLRPIQRLFRLELDNPVQTVNDDTIAYITHSGRVVKPPVRL